jgi:hypothetical protein
MRQIGMQIYTVWYSIQNLIVSFIISGKQMTRKLLFVTIGVRVSKDVNAILIRPAILKFTKFIYIKRKPLLTFTA